MRTDPATGLITWASKTRDLGVGDEEFAAAEYGPPDINSFTEIAGRQPPVGVLSVDTGGRPEQCRRHREFMRPRFGSTDELGVVFVIRDSQDSDEGHSDAATKDQGQTHRVWRSGSCPSRTSLERLFVTGSESNGPAGLPGVAGIETVDADPAAGLDAWTDAVAAIEANGGRATVGFVSPTTWASLSKVKESTGSATPLLADPGTGPTGDMTRSIGGLPVAVTASVADGEAG